MILTLSSLMKRLPHEIEALGLHDAVTLLQTLRRDEHAQLKFDAALHGCTLK